MIPSITVSDSTSAARAAFIEPLTASANCWLVAIAMYRGILAAAVAAPSAALQLVRRSFFAFATASSDEDKDSCKRNATKTSERMG